MNIQLRDIKARIDRVRLDNKLRQLDFSESIGLSQSGYSTLLVREGTRQRLKTLALSIEAVYGVRHEWILNGEEPKQKGVLEHLDPLQKVQLEILSDEGIAPQLKADSFRMMVANESQGVFLGLMMRSLAISRNIQDRGAPAKLIKKLEDNRIKADVILTNFDKELEESRENLTPYEQTVLVCGIYAQINSIKYGILQSIDDELSISNIQGTFNNLVEKIKQIRKLTKSDKEIEKWVNRPYIQFNRPTPQPQDGWKRKIGHGDENEK
jgi:hypothetical protein